MKNAVSDRDMQLIRSQAKGIHSASTLPISFCIGERRVTGLPEDFNPERRDVRISEHVVEHVYTGVHQDSGLAVTVYVTEYEDYPVFEIRASFTAAGDRNTAVIHDIRSFDGAFYGEIPVLFSNSGDVCSENGYARKEQLYTHEIWTDITPQCGRPCEQAFPYYKVQFKDSGLNLAIGWPGQWLAHFGTLTDGIRFWAGQQTTNLYIKPGETIIAPRITVMAYDGDYDRGTNLWRRWYREYILPRPNGKPIPPQLFASYNGGGREFQESTEENQLAYIDKFTASGLPYTAWWIDAGWYYCDSESPMATNGRLWYETGSWYADPARYPNGLRPLYEKLKEKGMDLLVWFEPERVRPGTACTGASRVAAGLRRAGRRQLRRRPQLYAQPGRSGLREMADRPYEQPDKGIRNHHLPAGLQLSAPALLAGKRYAGQAGQHGKSVYSGLPPFLGRHAGEQPRPLD